jgi:hypothetical protein
MYSLIKACAVLASKFFIFFILKYLQLFSSTPESMSSKIVDSAITATLDCFWLPRPLFRLFLALGFVALPANA